MMNNAITDTELEVTPAEAMRRLKEGNFRFINNMQVNKDLLGRIAETKDLQTPFAVVLSCMDSRVSTELVFDQGVGDVFSIRIAGNVVTDGILGSLEYSAAVAGAKLILVMGHTNCGAVKGACDGVEMGHLSSLLAQIKPAVAMETATTEERNSHNIGFVNSVARLNVNHSVSEIISRSPIIKQLVDRGELLIAPAMYDVATGKVNFNSFSTQL